MLWEKRLQAKQWLEKLKKTMSVPKVGKRAPSQRSSNSESRGLESQGSEESEESRPLLSDMKMMVMEGECLLSSTVGPAGLEPLGEGEAPVTSVAASSGTRGTVSSRELSKAQSVVEVAEEVNQPLATFCYNISPVSCAPLCSLSIKGSVDPTLFVFHVSMSLYLSSGSSVCAKPCLFPRSCTPISRRTDASSISCKPQPLFQFPVRQRPSKEMKKRRTTLQLTH